jgi:predicted transcriptional regulator
MNHSQSSSVERSSTTVATKTSRYRPTRKVTKQRIWTALLFAPNCDVTKLSNLTKVSSSTIYGILQCWILEGLVEVNAAAPEFGRKGRPSMLYQIINHPDFL